MKRNILAALFAAVGVLAVVVVQPAALWAAPVMVPALPSTEVRVRRLSSVNELKAALESGGRLFTIGNPADVDDYVQAVRRTPNLVLVVVERSANYQSDREVLGSALQNSDLVRRQLVDSFTGIPNGIAAIRVDRVDGGKGHMDIHTAPRLRAVGFSNEATFEAYAAIRKRGTSVAEALTEVGAKANAAVDADNAATVSAAKKAIVDGRQAIQNLSSQISESGFVPLGYSEAMPADWGNRLNEAQSLLNGATSLDLVNDSKAAAQAVVGEVARFQRLVNRELGGRVLRQLALQGLGGLILLGLIISSALTAQQRRKASAEVKAKIEDIDLAVDKVMKLLEATTFVAINATGKQKQEADRLGELNDQLLEQAVALQKFLRAAAGVLDSQGLGWVYHRLVPFGARYVASLATGEVTLTVSRQEIEDLLRTDGNLNADYEVRIGDDSDRQLSITDLIDAIERTSAQAQELFTRLSEADANLVSGIEEAERQAAALEAAAIAQTARATAGLFTGEPVLGSIVLAVMHPQTGHIAQAKRAQASNDALSGEEHLEPAARMIADGKRTLAVSGYGAATIVPAMQRTIGALGAADSGIVTDWPTERVQAASDRLNKVIQRAPFESVESALEGMERELQSLLLDLSDAIRVNELRLASWPKTLDEIIARVEKGQSTMLRGLHALGFFQSGDPADLLRETVVSPKGLVDEIRRAISEVVTALSDGDLERARAIEAQVAEWFTQINQLIAQSEERTSKYAAESDRLANAIATSHRMQRDLAQVVVRDASIYSSRSQKRACEDVLGTAVLLSEMLNQAAIATQAAQQLGDSAKADMQRGFVLTAGANLDEAQQHADSALEIQAAIPAAIALLEAKVGEAKAQFTSVTDVCRGLMARASKSGVRTATKRRLQEVSASSARIDQLVSSAPYEALRSLAENRTQLEQIARAIENDLRLAREIAQKLSDAEELEAAAQLALTQARARSFANATVNLGRADQAFSAYSSACSSLRDAIGQENYERALAEAQRAYREVSSVDQLATDAVSAAERTQSRHDDLMSYSHRSTSGTSDYGGYTSFSGGSDSSGSVDFSGGGD